MKKTLLLLATFGALSCIAAKGQTIIFVFGNNSGNASSQLDGLATGPATVTGLTLTATANTGTFNSTLTEGFGINATGGGDSTTEFDTGSGFAESMVFSFDQAGTFDSIDFSLLTENVDIEAVLSFSGGNSFDINNANTDGDDIFVVNEPFTAGQQITLSTSPANHNFSLDAITVTVPEPTTGVMLLGGAGLLILLRRRQS